MIKMLKNIFQHGWSTMRFILQDDAYDRYLAHWQTVHAQENEYPLDRKTFFKQELERKWGKGVNRCC